MDLALGTGALQLRGVVAPGGARGRRRRSNRALSSTPNESERLESQADAPRDKRLLCQCRPTTRQGPATVAELSQIPGARKALANYIAILQEWSARAEKGGAAPDNQR